jgi:hypothetical protein
MVHQMNRGSKGLSSKPYRREELQKIIRDALKAWISLFASRPRSGAAGHI